MNREESRQRQLTQTFVYLYIFPNIPAIAQLYSTLIPQDRVGRSVLPGTHVIAPLVLTTSVLPQLL